MVSFKPYNRKKIIDVTPEQQQHMDDLSSYVTSYYPSNYPDFTFLYNPKSGKIYVHNLKCNNVDDIYNKHMALWLYINIDPNLQKVDIVNETLNTHITYSYRDFARIIIFLAYLSQIPSYYDVVKDTKNMYYSQRWYSSSFQKRLYERLFVCCSNNQDGYISIDGFICANRTTLNE